MAIEIRCEIGQIELTFGVSVFPCGGLVERVGIRLDALQELAKLVDQLGLLAQRASMIEERITLQRHSVFQLDAELLRQAPHRGMAAIDPLAAALHHLARYRTARCHASADALRVRLKEHSWVAVLAQMIRARQPREAGAH